MHKKIKLSKSNLLLKVVAYVIMGLLAAMAILPCLHIISKAFSRGGCNGGQCSILAERFSARNGVVCTDENIIFKCIEKFADCYDRRYGDQYVYDDYDGVSSVQAFF